MSTPGGAQHTILIVDDNPQLLGILEEALTEYGNFTIVTAPDGITGLERFYEFRPDCVVIDVKMPKLNGYQLVRTLRGDLATAVTPLILLTAMVQDRDRFDGLASGVDQYLSKPIKPSELITAIHSAIAMGEDEREQRLAEMLNADLPPETE